MNTLPLCCPATIAPTTYRPGTFDSNVRSSNVGPHVAGSIIPYNTATADQNARMRQINAWIREQPGVVFVDTRAAAAAADNADRLFESPDGLHPSAAGYRRMADAIQPVLERVLK